MTDIAELGVVIDAKPIKAASDALRELTGVGKITEEVLKRLTDTGKRLTDGEGAAAVSSDRLTGALERQAARREKLASLAKQVSVSGVELASTQKTVELNDKLTESFNRSTVAAGKHRGAIRQAAHEMRSFSLDITGAAYLIVGFTAALAAPAIIGVKLASTLENTRLGMASILASMGRIDGASFGLPKALEISSVMTKQLVADSLKYGVSIESLANTLRATLAPGLASGLGLKQIQELATLGTLAVKTIGLDAKQTVQEVRDLVSGGITAASSTLATSLGVKDSDIKRWREAGELYERLTERLRGFSEASEASTRTLTGAWEQFKTKVSLLLSDDAGFTAIKDTLIGISESIATIDKITGEVKFTPAAIAAAQEYWDTFKGILGTLKDIADFISRPYEPLVIPVVISIVGGAKSFLTGIAKEVDSVGKLIADGIKAAVAYAVYGQTTETARPFNRGLGMGMTPPAEGEVTSLTNSTPPKDVGSDVTGTLGARLTAAEEFWKKFHVITREGLFEEHKDNLDAFEKQETLLKKQAELGRLADTPEALKKNAKDDLARLNRFEAAKREELESYSRKVKALDDAEAERKKKLSGTEVREFNIQIEARRAGALAHMREIKSIDEKIHAIDVLAAKEVSRGEASRLLASENRQTAEYLSIEATGAFGPVAPGTSELAGKYSTLAGKQQDQGTGFDAEDYAKRNAEAARRVADAWKETADSIKSSLGDAFGPGGQALSGFVGAYADGHARLADIEADRQERLKTTGLTAEETAAIQSRAVQQTELVTLQSYVGMASAAKGFFEKGSDGYKALAKAEQIFRVLQFAWSVRSMAQDAVETTASIAKSGARMIASAAAGAAKFFEQLGLGGFVGVAAMVAVLGALGARLSGGGGGGSAPESAESLQKSQGTGTVLGDSSAKSESLTKSLEIMSKNSDPLLSSTNEMVGILRLIASNILNLGAAVAKQLGLPGGAFDTSGLGLGSSNGAAYGRGERILSPLTSLVPAASKWAGEIGAALFGGKKKTTLLDQGLTFDVQTIGEAADAIRGSSYQDTKTKTSGGLFGKDKTSYDTQTQALSGDVSKWLSETVGSLRDGVVRAAGILGVKGAEETINALALGIDKISLKGMTGDQIAEALNGVMSTTFDAMAEAVIPNLKDLQRVGEGTGETLVRLVQTYVTVDYALESIGTSFKMVGVDSLEARDRLVEASGGLEEFQKKADFFAKNFLTSGEVFTILQKRVGTALADLGYSGIKTKEQFVALVQGLDVSTEEGAKAYASLMNISGAFSEMTKQIDALAAKRLDLEIQLLQVSGDAVGALALQRERELASLDESLRPLQEQIYAQQDLNKAYEKAVGTLKSLKLLTTDSFTTLFDYTKYLHQAARAGVPGAEAALPGNASNTFIPGKSNTSANAELVAAIDKLRAEQQAGQIAMSTYLQQTAAILRRWNGDGMPEVRAVAA